MSQTCVLCEEGITNPICIECLAKEMEQWLSEKRQFLTDSIREKVKVFKSYTHDGTNCIICGENMNVCAHCFSIDVYKWLKGDNEELAREFLRSFNYEIEV